MRPEPVLFLTSPAILADFRKIYTIHQQELSDGGWVYFWGDPFDLWFWRGDGSSISFHNSLTEQQKNGYLLEDDYGKLKAWQGAACNKIWLDRTGEIPPSEMPRHDLEITRVEQLEGIRKGEQHPSIDQCISWWNEWGLPLNVQRHATKVAWAAYILARMLRIAGEHVDPILTHRGGLLHDLDKIRTLREVNRHGQMSAEFLEEQGYPEVAEIVRGHILHTILEPSADERSWEVKLVYFCDKLTEGDQIVTLGERFNALGDRYPAYMKKMSRAKAHVQALNDRICSIVSIPDNQHLVSMLKAQYRRLEKE